MYQTTTRGMEAGESYQAAARRWVILFVGCPVSFLPVCAWK